MADGFSATDSTGTSVEILTDQVTDPDLAITGQVQYVKLMDGTKDGTNKSSIDSSGRLKVDASTVAVPVTDNSGSLTVDGTVAISSGPAAARTTDSIASALATDAIMNGLTVLTPTYQKITASSSGATTIVNAVTNKKIRVLSWNLTVNGAVNVKWQSHVTPTDVTGLYYFASNEGIAVAFSPVGHFETVAGEALDINLSGAVAVGGSLVYVTI